MNKYDLVIIGAGASGLSAGISALKSGIKDVLILEKEDVLGGNLNLFIDILANDIKDTNVIFLLDEPGVYLHVNAQRELLRLFYDLCKNDNQVVYSTHSPYMIDSNNIINIRAIEKDERGHTNIYNTAYDNKFNSIYNSI